MMIYIQYIHANIGLFTSVTVNGVMHQFVNWIIFSGMF